MHSDCGVSWQWIVHQLFFLAQYASVRVDYLPHSCIWRLTPLKISLTNYWWSAAICDSAYYSLSERYLCLSLRLTHPQPLVRCCLPYHFIDTLVQHSFHAFDWALAQCILKCVSSILVGGCLLTNSKESAILAIFPELLLFNEMSLSWWVLGNGG